MNIIMKLTARHLKSNFKRTVVTIFGIVAATALITAMMVGLYSAFSFVADVSLMVDGYWEAIVKDVSEEQLEALKNDGRLAHAGIMNRDNEITGIRVRSDARERFRLGNIYHCDTDNLAQKISCDYDGVLPSAPGEIAVEEEFLKENGLDINVGDTLSFEQGYRYHYEEGKIVYLAGTYRSDEEFVSSSDETLTVTAILHHNEPTSGYDVIRIMDDSFPVQNYVYLSLKDVDIFAVRNLKNIAATHGVKLFDINSEYLMSIFAVDLPGETYSSVFRIMIFALAIIIASSVLMIYNAFAMSLNERMKYLGMLASVGATRRQKRASVYYEGFVLGLIGIPLGILTGILGSSVTLGLIGSVIIDSEMIRGVKTTMENIPVKVHPVIFIFVVLFAAITIFLSSFIPAIRASKVTPIEALRQSKDIRLKAWKLKVFPPVRWIFGYEGELASKNIKRNGAKGVVITISMAVSVIMFLGVFYFVNLFNMRNDYEVQFPFQVFASASLSESDRLYEDISKLEGVDKIMVAEMISFDREPVDDEGKPLPAPNPAFWNPEYLTSSYSKLFESSKSVWIIPLMDDTFRGLCSENGIDPEGYFGDELCGLLLNNFNHVKTKKVFNESVIGQKLFYDDPVGNPPAVTISGLIDWDESFEEFRLSPKNSVSVYVPVSVYHREYVKNVSEDELSCTFGIQCEDHEGICKKVSDILEFDGYSNTSCSDVESELLIMKSLVTLLKTIMYGFSILISMIVIANIVNTISTGVQLRRKEFAMFKSVGMTEKGFKKMLFLETFLYGFRAVFIAVPVSVLLSYMMYSLLDSGTVPFEINWLMYLAAIAGVFAVVSIGMLLSAGSIRHDSVIDVLKEDIC